MTVAFIGDGTLGQGVVYESLNIASRWGLPLLVVVENNFYAQSTPSQLTLAGRIADRGAAFGIETAELDTTDVAEIWDAAAEIVPRVRTSARPFFLVLNTYRYSPHSKGDDNRDPAEIETARERDPLGVAGARLTEDEQRDDRSRTLSSAGSTEAIADRGRFARGDARGRAEMEERCARRHQHGADRGLRERATTSISSARTSSTRTAGRSRSPRASRTRWPQRVITTPVSEGAIFGVAAGMALRGWRPILEIMFGDFIALGFDQTVNGIAKFRAMFDDQVRVPLVVRTPMGGRRGYGPTHSQTLEKLLLGVPGIKVVAPSECHDIGALLLAAIADDDPVFFIENKLMYGRPNRRPADGRARRPPVRRDGRAVPGALVLGQRLLGRRDDNRHVRRHAADRARGGGAADHRGRAVHGGRLPRAGCCRSTSSPCSSRSRARARSSRSRRGR